MNLENLSTIFSAEYARNAFVVGILISVCTAILGVEIVLKKYSMLGDGLSHVSFGTLAVASAFNFASMEISLVIVIIVAFFLLQIRQNSKINGDAAVAIVSGSFMAIGIFASNLSGGVNTEFNSYMFGSIFAIKDNFALSVIMCVVVIAVFCLFYNKIFAVTFDEDFSKATGGKTGLYNLIIAVLTAVTVVVGMKLIGTLIISSLTVFPVVASLKVSKNYRTSVIIAVVFSLIAFITGFVLTACVDKLPLSSAIIFCNLIILGFSLMLSYLRKRKNV